MLNINIMVHIASLIAAGALVYYLIELNRQRKTLLMICSNWANKMPTRFDWPYLWLKRTAKTLEIPLVIESSEFAKIKPTKINSDLLLRVLITNRPKQIKCKGDSNKFEVLLIGESQLDQKTADALTSALGAECATKIHQEIL